MANSRPCKLGISLGSGGIFAPFILAVSTEHIGSHMFVFQQQLPSRGELFKMPSE